MTLRLFYIAVILAMMTILPFFPRAGFSVEETEPPVAKAPKRKEREEVQGKIVKIDPATKRLRIVPGIFGRDKEICVTAQTQITTHGRPAVFNDLRTGDKVRVECLTSDGRERTAQFIEVL